MAQFVSRSSASYSGAGPTVTNSGEGDFDFTLLDGSPPPDVTFNAGDTFQGTFETFQGTITYMGNVFLVTFNGANYSLFSGSDLADVTFPPSFDLADIDPSPFIVCFGPGTRIATPDGETRVEDLAIGDMIRTQDGRDVAIKWIGRQTLSAQFTSAERLRPVRIAAGALGPGCPDSDLTLTSDHAVLIDGVLCHAGALLNGTTVTRLSHAEMGDLYTIYHIETEAHDIILANGVGSETFIDNVSRRAFDNFAEFDALYGDVPEMRDLPLPRAMSARQVPVSIRTALLRRSA